MRRSLLAAPLLVVALVAGASFLLRPSPSPARQGKEAEARAPLTQEGTAGPLPIAQVVLFSSGVGYFQREGTVSGNARIDLAFPVTDINDLLKSLVVRDLDGGLVSTVSYDSNAPLDRTLKSFAVNLTGNPALAEILNQARGEKVEVVLQQTSATQPGTLTGTVIGLEKQKVATGKEPLDVDVLNLWCADGVHALKMPEVLRLRFLNPVLDGEFRKALETLAQAHDTQKKSVSLTCLGSGERRLRVGYVVENPIWKTSYRLVLAKDKGDKPYLQGWAVVENPSDEDWRDVRMALISGRPISFQMDLYQPRYVSRPVEELELFASLRPPTYSGDLKVPLVVTQVPKTPPAESEKAVAGDREVKEQLRKADEPANRAALGRRMAGGVGGMGDNTLEGRLDLAGSVASAASAAKLGDYFRYLIDKPVTLPRQKSALLPIVAKDVEGSRVSIYNEGVQAKFPLLGLKFKNTSGLHLMQGPVTVFEGSNYAGDALAPDLQPGEERLLSYAIDLGTEVNAVPKSDNGHITALKLVKGILHTTTKVRESKTYTLTNRSDQERLVLIEHPVRQDFTLVETAKPAETARDVYRFQVRVPAGKTETQKVTEEKVFGTQVQLTNADDNQVRFFLSQPAIRPKVKEALTRALALREELARTQREVAEQERQLKGITEDQARLRANLKEMPPTAAAYKRYLEKFDRQETQIERYQADVKKLQGTEHAQRKAYEDYLANLEVE